MSVELTNRTHDVLRVNIPQTLEPKKFAQSTIPGWCRISGDINGDVQALVIDDTTPAADAVLRGAITPPEEISWLFLTNHSSFDFYLQIEDDNGNVGRDQIPFRMGNTLRYLQARRYLIFYEYNRRICQIVEWKKPYFGYHYGFKATIVDDDSWKLTQITNDTDDVLVANFPQLFEVGGTAGNTCKGRHSIYGGESSTHSARELVAIIPKVANTSLIGAITPKVEAPSISLTNYTGSDLMLKIEDCNGQPVDEVTFPSHQTLTYLEAGHYLIYTNDGSLAQTIEWKKPYTDNNYGFDATIGPVPV